MTTEAMPDVKGLVEEDTKPNTNKRAKNSETVKPLTEKQLRENLDGTFVGIGGALIPFDPWCGAVLVTKGPEVTDALIELGKTNPRVKKAIDNFARGSIWSAVFGAAGAVLIPILAHHGILPGRLGVMFGPDLEQLQQLGVDTDQLIRDMVGIQDDDGTTHEHDNNEQSI